MKNFSLLFLGWVLLLAMAGLAGADETISVKAGCQVFGPKGIFSGNHGGHGTAVDFEKALDFGNSREPTAEAALQLGNFRLSAGFLPLEISVRGTLASTVAFNGKTFALGENVASDIDAAFFDLGLAYYLLNIDDLPVRVQLGPELTAKVVTGEIAILNEASGLQEEVNGTAGLPTVGGRFRVAFADFVGLAARVGYGSLQGSSLLDLDGQIEFSPLPVVGIYAGYRHLDLDMDESDMVLDSQFAGPYGGMLVRF